MSEEITRTEAPQLGTAPVEEQTEVVQQEATEKVAETVDKPADKPVDKPVVEEVEQETTEAPEKEDKAGEEAASEEDNDSTVERPTQTPKFGTDSVHKAKVDTAHFGIEGGGEIDLDITITESSHKLITEAGLDPLNVTKELWEGEFGLSDATLKALTDKHGETLIKAVMDGAEASARLAVMQQHNSVKEAERATEELWSEVLEEVGGEEAWKEMDAFATKNFNDDEIAQFNTAMNSGDKYYQMLAIRDLKSRVESGTLHLITQGAGAAPSESSAGMLSAAQFKELFESGEYRKDPAKYDAMRLKGIQRGL